MTTYGFSQADARVLVSMIEWFKHSRGGPSLAAGGALVPTCRIYLAKLDDTLDGRSGSTPGSQTATLCQINDDGEIEERSEAESITVYNAFESDSGETDTYVFIAKDVFGTYWVISEDCP